MRDGRKVDFDSFDPPEDGGRPAWPRCSSSSPARASLTTPAWCGRRVPSRNPARLTVARGTLAAGASSAELSHERRVRLRLRARGHAHLARRRSRPGRARCAIVPPGTAHGFANEGDDRGELPQPRGRAAVISCCGSMNEQFCKVGDVELCYETFGEPGDPAVLLIMGLGTQMIAWHEDFCGQLVDRGFFVIRYDNRDCGRSTRFDQVPPPTPVELALRRPKRRGLHPRRHGRRRRRPARPARASRRAHVVGASMGGMIAQLMAARHPERVLSLVSIMSSTGSRWSGQPAPRVLPVPARPARRSARRPTWSGSRRCSTLVGSPGFERDEQELRELGGAELRPRRELRRAGAPAGRDHRVGQPDGRPAQDQGARRS